MDHSSTSGNKTLESLGHDRHRRECRFISKRIFAEKTDILEEIGFGNETLAKEERSSLDMERREQLMQDRDLVIYSLLIITPDIEALISSMAP
ncbi:hypothetical protein DAPPUDRAFT_233939 [Daphnia pulex]|uniref:Uncharacterized protein n=1 Tax=Daphnia pulex TaxID=6669 RepID=E9FW57_DAPPU|nr:hypothetical protein DAPPUDRAFT_233939 [Daphnia pulex]|eukprot:EFX88666.1 hypothetical protein DAPPUDRAFT_233939 [Daphnia pulex]